MTVRRATLLLAVLVLMLVAVAGCGGHSTGVGTSGSQGASKSAADFVRVVTTQFSRGQSGRLWDELLPADQRIVSRARFVECQANEGWNLKSLNVLEAYEDPVQIGVTTVPATAVSVRVTSDEGVTTATMHAVSVNGIWHWVLQAADRNAYRKGTCPSSG